MILKTKLGEFTAQVIKEPLKYVYCILSIPYAKAGRFELPKRIKAYPRNKCINSNKSFCFPQRRIPKFINVFLKHHMMRSEFLTENDVQTEDAFVLNVWTSGTETKKPVLVYIHGGGDYGSGTSPIYNGAHLAARDIVVVTITYRVGIAGYMPVYDEQGLNCNRAAFDQQAALFWIRENIEHLGGDPGNITLMGQSGGALSALNQLLNTESGSLFDKLILCGGPMPTAIKPDDTEEVYHRVLKENNIKGFNELKNLPLRKLMSLKVKNAMNDVIDGKFFKKDPKESLKNGEFPRIPILVGANADEFSMVEIPMFYKGLGITAKKKELSKALQKKYGNYADIIRKELETESNGIIDLQIKMLELAVFHTVSYRLLEVFCKTCRVYGYRFCYVPNLYKGLRGSYHGAEVAMFFGNLDKMNIRITDKNRLEMSWVQKDWLSFIRNGDIPDRKLYDIKNKEIILYEKEPTVVAFPHSQLIERLADTDIYETAFGNYLKNR